MTLTADTRIRDCRFDPGESAAIAGIWRRAWAVAHPDSAALEPIAHWLRRVQAEFGSPAETLLVERGGQVLAFMGLHPARHYIAQLYVDPHLRGQGFGRALLDEACRRMPTGWHLHVATINGGAQRFYERYGLLRGSVDCHPATGRERVGFHWHPGVA